MPVNRSTIQAKTSQTAAFQSAGLDVSGFTGDYTVKIRVDALTAGNARFVIEETTNNFATVFPLAQLSVTGPLPTEGVAFSFRKREAAGTDVAGGAGAKIRLNMIEISGGGTATFEAWTEN